MSLHDFVLHRPPHQGQPERPERRFPRSWVRVLQTDDELHDAVELALGFERDLVERTSARVAHYEGLNRSGELFAIHPGGSPNDQQEAIHPEAV
jgi:hypothetical protein